LLEETKAGLRFKGPKSDMGKRTISLPASAVAMLRDHPLGLLELRLAIGRQQARRRRLAVSQRSRGLTDPTQPADAALAGCLQGPRPAEGLASTRSGTRTPAC